MFINLLKEVKIQKYISDCLSNNWAGTEWEDYPLLGAKQKGGLGELLIENRLKKEGNQVTPSESTDHDRMVNKKKLEIKFSLASSNKGKDGKLIDPDNFTFNHIGLKKDWDILLLAGINPCRNQLNVRTKDHSSWPSERIYYIHKKDLVRHMACNKPLLKPQQGGKKANNDDYILAGRNKFLEFIELPYVHEYKGGRL